METDAGGELEAFAVFIFSTACAMSRMTA